MHRLSFLIETGTKTFNGAGMILLLLMIVHVTLDVAMRFLFNMPLPGTIMVVSLFYMIAVAFLPLAAVEERDAHISVEIVTELLPAYLQSCLRVFSIFFSTLVFGLLTFRTGVEAVTKFRIGAYVVEAGTRVPTWPPYFFLPIGFGLMTLVLLCRLLKRVPSSEKP